MAAPCQLHAVVRLRYQNTAKRSVDIARREPTESEESPAIAMARTQAALGACQKADT